MVVAPDARRRDRHPAAARAARDALAARRGAREVRRRRDRLGVLLDLGRVRAGARGQGRSCSPTMRCPPRRSMSSARGEAAALIRGAARRARRHRARRRVALTHDLVWARSADHGGATSAAASRSSRLHDAVRPTPERGARVDGVAPIRLHESVAQVTPPVRRDASAWRCAILKRMECHRRRRRPPALGAVRVGGAKNSALKLMAAVPAGARRHDAAQRPRHRRRRRHGGGAGAPRRAGRAHRPRAHDRRDDARPRTRRPTSWSRGCARRPACSARSSPASARRTSRCRAAATSARARSTCTSAGSRALGVEIDTEHGYIDADAPERPARRPRRRSTSRASARRRTCSWPR